jgi:hypothetical protein
VPVSEVARAHALIDDDPDAAYGICNEVLSDNPDDPLALFVIGTVLARSARHGIALPVFERVARIVPGKPQAWNNIGMCYAECHDYGKAREAFMRAEKLQATATHKANIALTWLNDGDYKKAIEWCKKAMESEPEHNGAWTTFGFASLAVGDWANGWKGFSRCLGGKFRKEVHHQDAPRWTGEKGQTVCVYGEQGIGDEIMYASCFDDVIRDSKQVVIECDNRLEGLFRRSFPDALVYGTRRLDAPWVDSVKLDANCAAGELPRFYRPDRKDCPQTPYLKADPERRLQWRALFDSWPKKPVIGLCWTGGRQSTQSKRRHVGLEAMRSLIESTDAHFVSLQYKDPTAEIEASGLPVKHFARAAQSPDFDDTAALVAECDIVIGIHTTVHHLAGALGVPSIILVPDRPMWNYATGDSLPWYGKQKYHRQRANESWADCVKRIQWTS